MKEITKTYEAKNAEQKWYQAWKDDQCFSAGVKVKHSKEPRESFSIVMPPPNVTGKLHMGHALDATCQDVLVRYKRMNGFDTVWVPGVDHAGIATQSVVEKKIFKENKQTKHDLGREKFLEEVWAWKDKHMSEITDQLEKLGVSCDWNYMSFTMDDNPCAAVRKFFVKLYDDGLIYQSERIINWDTTLQSAISDAEVESKEVKGNFYYIKYYIDGESSDNHLTIATTRPETLFGDTAVAINPNDKRYKHLIGKNAKLPITGRLLPIVGDEYVDMELGTGCLKVTPGHDFNDFEIGQRHKLEIINLLKPDGTFRDGVYDELTGLDVKRAREKTVELLKKYDQLIDIEEKMQMVGHGERSDTIIEPMVSKQWFLNISQLASEAVKSVESEDMKFFPKSWENTYFAWLREPKDWCLSRQLWWGHRIPVFTCNSCGHTWADEQESPLKCPNCSANSYTQDPDVLDTWFSSALWPLSTLGWPNESLMKERGFDKYFPNTLLVTGYDIIFFWVARMMMSSLYLKKTVPFRHTYIHGIVRDKQGRKMSKSLGNGIDPLVTIDKYGCDAVRFTLAAGAGHNRGLNLDPERIEGYRNFMNKLWNAFRFIAPSLNAPSEDGCDQHYSFDNFDSQEKWILQGLNDLISSVRKSIEDYRFDDASSSIYKFVYDCYCSWFIELSKPILQCDDNERKAKRVYVLRYCMENMLKLIHPICPFISEEIWSCLGHKSYIMHEAYPEVSSDLKYHDELQQMNEFIEVVSSIRNVRLSVNLKPKDEIHAVFFTDDKKLAQFLYDNRQSLKDLCGVIAATIHDKSHARPRKCAAATSNHCEVYIKLEGLINIEEEVQRLQKKMSTHQVELEKYEKKLKNDSFISRAPKSIINEVKDKAKGATEKIATLQSAIELLT